MKTTLIAIALAAAKSVAPQAGQPGVVASATQSAVDGSGATF